MKADLLSTPLSSYKLFFRNGFFIDSGPLMLLLYGQFDKKHGTQYLKEIHYTSDHYELLLKFIVGVPTKKICITPHVFHELYKNARKHFGSRLSEFFTECSSYLINIEEKDAKKNKILTHDLFLKLDIGEHSLVCTCEDEKPGVIFHDDHDINGKLEKNQDILTINFKQDAVPFILTNSG